MHPANRPMVYGTLALFGVVILGVGLAIMNTSSSPIKSTPEVVFEPKSVFQCEIVGSIGTTPVYRCTDTERDVTCYNVRKSDPLSCLPNQWLNYPTSIGNVNDPIAQ